MCQGHRFPRISHANVRHAVDLRVESPFPSGGLPAVATRSVFLPKQLDDGVDGFGRFGCARTVPRVVVAALRRRSRGRRATPSSLPGAGDPCIAGDSGRSDRFTAPESPFGFSRRNRSRIWSNPSTNRSHGKACACGVPGGRGRISTGSGGSPELLNRPADETLCPTVIPLPARNAPVPPFSAPPEGTTQLIARNLDRQGQHGRHQWDR